MGDMTRVKHSRLDPNGRKARHFSETGALALLPEMEVDLGNQAHARGAGTHQAISRTHA